jgi:thymidine kinase
MFIEPHLGRYQQGRVNRTGWIEVICGSMFSGKTEELIRRLKRAQIARQKVEIFKPAIDTRYHALDVVSHDANSIRSTPIYAPHEMILLAGNSDVVGIDETQFFDEGIVEVCVSLANTGKRVIVAGLDMDFQGKPFGCVPALMAVAEFVTKVHAICAVCGSVASFSYRLVLSKEKVLLGETESYEARCRRCFNEGMAKSGIK